MHDKRDFIKMKIATVVIDFPFYFTLYTVVSFQRNNL